MKFRGWRIPRAKFLRGGYGASSNLDCRSFRLSFEVNCLVYDQEASSVLEGLFDDYRSRSGPVDDPGRYDRTFRDRLLYVAACLASPLL